MRDRTGSRSSWDLIVRVRSGVTLPRSGSKYLREGGKPMTEAQGWILAILIVIVILSQWLLYSRR